MQRSVFTVVFYARRVTLSEIHHCLCVLERGTIARGGTSVPQNAAFQLDMIISNWNLQDVRQTMSLTYYQVLGLDRRNLERSFETISTTQGKATAFFHWHTFRTLGRNVHGGSHAYLSSYTLCSEARSL